MGEAKRKKQKIENYWKEVNNYTDKFDSITSFPAFTYSGDMQTHSIKAYEHLMRLIFLRAKHLNKAIIDSLKNQNSYASFTLIKSYWETVAMLGYSYVSANNYIKNNDYKTLLSWATRHTLGGKKYPSEKALEEKGIKREEMQQTNLLTWMQKMDEDFNKNVGKHKKISEFKNMYDEFIAEAGHSTFLGLSLCEERQSNGSLIPFTNKTYQSDDEGMTLNHLSLCNIYLFYYWDKFISSKVELNIQHLP